MIVDVSARTGSVCGVMPLYHQRRLRVLIVRAEMVTGSGAAAKAGELSCQCSRARRRRRGPFHNPAHPRHRCKHRVRSHRFRRQLRNRAHSLR